MIDILSLLSRKEKESLTLAVESCPAPGGASTAVRITCPNDQRQILLSVNFDCSTDASAGNRYPQISWYLKGGLLYGYAMQQAAYTASQTGNTTFALGIDTITAVINADKAVARLPLMIMEQQGYAVIDCEGVTNWYILHVTYQVLRWTPARH